jgi:drug/metabolite transporter (DMT)-like permease
MSAKRMVGIVLVVIGIAALVWGGIFWTERETVIDAGPLEVTTEDTEGIPLSPLLGVLSLVGGIVLLALPDRRRV